MFDELIIPAARLLDTVESRIRDYKTTHSKQQEQNKQDNKIHIQQTSRRSSEAAKPFRPPKPLVNPPHTLVNRPKQIQIEPLADYKTPVFEEQNVIDWGTHSHYKDQQAKQACYRQLNDF